MGPYSKVQMKKAALMFTLSALFIQSYLGVVFWLALIDRFLKILPNFSSYSNLCKEISNSLYEAHFQS